MLHFVDIKSANDDLFVQWVELYETSFPPEERILVSRFLSLLKEKSEGKWPESFVQAATDDEGKFCALLRFDLIREREAAYFWYLAVHPEARNGGIGAECFAHVLKRATEAGMRALLWEVEVPEHFPDRERQEFARRRIGFYRRQGAQMLTGIDYMQKLPYQPPIPLHVMVRPIQPVTPQDVFDLAQRLLEGVTQAGELGLD